MYRNIAAVVASAFLLVVPVFAAENETQVTRLTRSATSKFFLRFTPDGSHILYSSQHANRRSANLVLVGARIVKADGTNDRPLLTPFNAQVQIQEHPCISPDGSKLLISGGGNDTGNASKDVFIADLDKSFQATNLRKAVPGDGVTLGEEPVWSPDGKQMVFVSIDERIWSADADGKNKTTLAQLSGVYCHQPDWSPDGQWVAFASDREGNIEIFKVRRDGTDLTRLTEHPGIDGRPRFSRDGRWILFSSNRARNFDLYVMRADGSDVRQLTNHLAADDHADWSPDAKAIAFVSLRDGAFDIYRMPVPADLRIGDRIVPGANPGDGPSGDLALHYAFDRESPTDRQVVDIVGRNHGQLLDARIIKEDFPGESPRGRAQFDGLKSSINCGNGESLRITKDLTISLWVRPATFSGNHYLVSKQGWNIYLGSNGIPHFETRSALDQAWDTLPGMVALKAGEWSQVVAVFDPTQQKLRLYLNGKLTAEKPRLDGSLGAATSYPLELGHYNLSQSQKFVGQMDEVRIYKRALTPDEIASAFLQQASQIFVREK